MKNFNTLLLGLLLLGVASCKRDIHTPFSDDGNTPGPVKNPQVTNLSGAARIAYTLPDNDNLLYVKATFTINGAKSEVKSSFYNNNLLVEGFGDTLEHEVMLYAVSRGEKASDPVKVMIKPLTPPVKVVRNSLFVDATFGGIYAKFLNPSGTNIVVKVLVWDDVKKEWANIDDHYTSLESGQFAVRGMPPVERKFGVYIQDRWGNVSDTLIALKTPIYEEQLDKALWKDIRKKNYPIPQVAPLPGSGLPIVEAVDYSSSWKLTQLWDDNVTKGFHTKEKYDQPIWIPIDLGQKVILSRYKIWQRPGTFAFQHGNPHQWEIWGTNDVTNVNSWVKLDAQVMIKPSGLPAGINSNEDLTVIDEGQEYEFPLGSTQAVRYIAWKHVDSWSSIGGQTGHLHMMEMTLWGQVQ